MQSFPHKKLKASLLTVIDLTVSSSFFTFKEAEYIFNYLESISVSILFFLKNLKYKKYLF